MNRTREIFAYALRLLLFFAFLVVPVFVMAQQNKKNRKPRAPRPNMVANLEPYRAVVIPDNVNLVLKMGEVPSVEVQAEKAIVKNLVCEVKGGVLYVSLLPCKITQQWPHVKVIVGVDSTFREVTAALGGNISSTGLLRLESLTVNAGNRTNTNLSLDVRGALTVNTLSSCDVRLIGKASHVSFSALKNTRASLKGFSAQSTSLVADAESKVLLGPSPDLHVEAHDFSIVYYDASIPPVSSVVDTGAQLVIETRDK